MRIIWIRFLPLPDGHSAFQLTLQVLEAPLFPWASCRILIPLKSNCRSLMNYDLVSKIVCHCAIHLTHMMCLSIFGNDWWKTFFLISLCFFFNSFQYLSNNMFLTILRWLIKENVVEEEKAEDANQQNDSKCCESRLVIQFQGSTVFCRVYFFFFSTNIFLTIYTSWQKKMSLETTEDQLVSWSKSKVAT